MLHDILDMLVLLYYQNFSLAAIYECIANRIYDCNSAIYQNDVHDELFRWLLQNKCHMFYLLIWPMQMILPYPFPKDEDIPVNKCENEF